MDYLQFISEITKALAWPVTVVVLVLILKKPLVRSIVRLIDTLTKLKYGDLELEFEHKVEEAKQAADKAKLPEAPLSPLIESIIEGTDVEYALRHPAIAIQDAFLEVVEAGREAAIRHNLNVSPGITSVALQNLLKEHGILDPDQAEVFEDLRRLRNKAAHTLDFKLPRQTTLDYVLLARRLAHYLGTTKPTAGEQDQPA